MTKRCGIDDCVLSSLSSIRYRIWSVTGFNTIGFLFITWLHSLMLKNVTCQNISRQGRLRFRLHHASTFCEERRATSLHHQADKASLKRSPGHSVLDYICIHLDENPASSSKQSMLKCIYSKWQMVSWWTKYTDFAEPTNTTLTEQEKRVGEFGTTCFYHVI